MYFVAILCIFYITAAFWRNKSSLLALAGPHFVVVMSSE